jgi:tRNA A-37 threonylcarbamoyl transferase component Bud32
VKEPDDDLILPAAEDAPALDLALPAHEHSPAAVPDELLVRYRPLATIERWFQYRFSAWSEIKAWFAMTLVVLFFAFGGPGLVLRSIIYLLMGSAASTAAAAAAAQINSMVVQFVLLALAMTVVIAGGYYLVQPTHLALSSRGLRLRWKRFFGELSGPLTRWDRLNHIYLSRPGGTTSPQDWRLCFRSADGDRLALKLGAIPTAEERERLLAAVDDWAPAVTRDPEVIEALSPPQDYSYTELWLQALSAPPKRERLTPLPEGALLQNGRYLVRGQLGVGGQGTAYLAVERAETGNGDGQPGQSTVVLKESILPVYVEVSVRRQALERFQREAAMLRQLDCPQVVRLRDFFVEDHRSYLVLEHIDGCSLRQLVQSQGPQPEETVSILARQMCDILAYLHGLTPPVVHRDFTPDNLILNSDGVLKLVDFTVAHQSESTATGTVVGKHAYLPPEQFRGKPIPQSDIYALGATLYYLLVGEDPEPITTSHPILKRDDLSPEMDAIVAKATATEASARYASVSDVKQDLLRGACQGGNI